MKPTSLLAFSALLAAAPSSLAALSGTINANARPISSQTSTTGNFISLADLQAILTTRADLSRAAVLTGEAADGSSQTTLASETASAVFTISGANRYSRNDATATAETPHVGASSGIVVGINPGAAPRGRFNLVDSTQTLTLGSNVPEGVTHFGAIFYNYLTPGSANLVRVTANFSNGSTAVFDAANGFTMAGAKEFTFVGFAAPEGASISSIKIDETAGGGWMVCDDFTIVVGEPGAVPSANWKGVSLETPSDGKWSTAGNWEAGTVPLPDDVLLFNPSADSTLVNDLAAGTTFADLRFPVGTNPYIIEGNSLTTAAITNLSSQSQWIQLPLDLSSPLAVSCTGPVELSGVLSGAEGLAKSGPGPLVLSAANTHSGITTISSGPASVFGDQSAATGGWAVGPTSAAASSVTFESGSTIHVAAGRQIQVANNAPAGTANQVLNAAGSVSNEGELYVGRPGILNLEDGAVWNQIGPMGLHALGGYDAILNLKTGATLTYTGLTPILANGASANLARGLFNIAGGTLVTGTGFEQTTVPTTGFGRVTLSEGGTLRASADIPALTTGVQFQLGGGGGTIDTQGFNLSLAAPLGGSGGLTKAGTGTLTLENPATFSGDTVVLAGTLTTRSADSFDDASTVEVKADAVLHLDFTGSEIVAGLILGNEIQGPGTYSALNSPLLDGDGVIVVPSPDPYDDWITAFPALTLPADREKSANPDQDDLDNLTEFALDSDPSSGTRSGKMLSRIAEIGGSPVLVLTLPVVKEAVADPVLPGDGELVLLAGSLRYAIRGSADLDATKIDVSEIVGPDASALAQDLPALSTFHEYRSFRLVSPVATAPRGFLSVEISEVP
jgi:autotransporter-associated beta strand protein